MAFVHLDQFGRALPPPRAGTPDGTEGPPLPPDMCRLCWRDRLQWRDGVWMLDHIGPYDSCLHACHDSGTFLDSTS